MWSTTDTITDIILISGVAILIGCLIALLTGNPAPPCITWLAWPDSAIIGMLEQSASPQCVGIDYIFVGYDGTLPDFLMDTINE